MIKCRLRYWIFAWMILQALPGFFILFQFSIQRHIERFKEDPFGFIFVSLIVFGASWGFQIIFLKFFLKEVIIHGEEVIVKRFIPARRIKYNLNDLKYWQIVYGKSEQLLLCINEKKIYLSSATNTNIKIVKDYLLKNYSEKLKQ